MIKYILMLAAFVSLNTFAKSEKRDDVKRMPASAEMIGQEAKSLFFSLYATYVSGGNVRIERSTNTGETNAIAEDRTRGSVVCTRKSFTGSTKPNDESYLCKVN